MRIPQCSARVNRPQRRSQELISQALISQLLISQLLISQRRSASELAPRVDRSLTQACVAPTTLVAVRAAIALFR